MIVNNTYSSLYEYIYIYILNRSISEASAPAWEMRDNASVVHHIYTYIKNTHIDIDTQIHVYIYIYDSSIDVCLIL